MIDVFGQVDFYEFQQQLPVDRGLTCFVYMP